MTKQTTNKTKALFVFCSILLLTLLSTIVSSNGSGIYNCEENRISYWKFDENSGNTAYDFVENNDGTLNGPTWDSGVVENALNFDGSNDYVDAGTFSISGSSMTLMVWFKADDYDGDARIVSKADGTSEASHWWMISERNNKLRFRLKTGGTTTTLIDGDASDTVATSGSLSTGVWTHAAVVYDGSTMKIYKDGILIASRAKSGAISVDNTKKVWIGASPDGSNWFDGLLDEVTIWSRTLNATEIFDLYNSSKNNLHYCHSCGDTVLDLDEQCDDGNLQNGDSCSSTCEDEQFCTDIGYDSGLLCADTGYNSGSKLSDYIISRTGNANHLSSGGICGVSGEYYIDEATGVLVLETPALPTTGEYIFTFEHKIGGSNDAWDEDFNVKCGGKTYNFPDTVFSPEIWREKKILCDLNAGKNNITFSSLDTGSVHIESFRLNNCCNDTDSDGVCDKDDKCPNSNIKYPSNKDGCDPIQFCNQFICGGFCDTAIFVPKEKALFGASYGCTTAIKHLGGFPYPTCAAYMRSCEP
jgi:cysteine-rich repeat protein